MKSYRGFITKLGPEGVFVFGSNTLGYHAGGAAWTAVDRFGAVMGQARGLQGQSYAIPTCTGEIEPLQVDAIKKDVEVFLYFVDAHPEFQFYLTPIGTGISGIDAALVAPLFLRGRELSNLVFPEAFLEYVSIPGEQIEIVDTRMP